MTAIALLVVRFAGWPFDPMPRSQLPSRVPASTMDESMTSGRRGLHGRLLIAAAVAAIALAACSPADDVTWERARETGLLRIGMDASFPPFEAVAPDGSLVGFDVDLAREVSRRLDLEPEFVANLPYDGLYDALTAQRVDVVFSALVVNPARTADFAYSRSYFDAGEVLVLGEGEQTIQAMTDLEGHRLAVALGTQGDQAARRWARGLTDVAVVQHQTPADALNALGAGQADAALVDRVSALHAIAEGRNLTIVGEPVIEVPYAAAVRRDSPRLLRAIDEALEAMDDDGTLDRLVAKWLEGD
jgi:ABC-type amino acid transport substrate-binding protein